MTLSDFDVFFMQAIIVLTRVGVFLGGVALGFFAYNAWQVLLHFDSRLALAWLICAVLAFNTYVIFLLSSPTPSPQAPVVFIGITGVLISIIVSFVIDWRQNRRKKASNTDGENADKEE